MAAITSGMLAAGAIVGGAGLAGSAIQANAAGQAASAQSNAATQAAQIQAQAANRATDLQQAVYTDQRNLATPQGILGAGALSRQARMAGLSTGEINNFYNGQVGAFNAPFAGIPAGGVSSTYGEAELAQRYPDLYSQWNGMDNDGINGNAARARQQYGDFTGYVRALNGADAVSRTPATQQTGNVDYAARDLGNLDEFAPQSFSFTADDLYADPSYQFRRDQGLQAVERSAAARGRLFSGATGQALQDYGQQSASQEYDNAYTRAFNAFQIEDTNRWNRLGALSGAGADAQAQLINSGNQFAQGASQTLQNAGNAQAQGVLNAGNARASGYQAQGQAWGGFFNNTVPGFVGFGMGQGWFK